MNQNYGKLVNGAIIYAPSSLNTPAGLIVNPKRLSYLQAGWKSIDLTPPSDPAPEGEEYAINGYTEDGETIHAVCKLVPLEKPPRTFSKLRLINALMTRNLRPAHPLARPSGSPTAKVPSARPLATASRLGLRPRATRHLRRGRISLRCMSAIGSMLPAITTSSLRGAGYAVASRPSLASLGAFPKISARIIRSSPPD